MGDWGDKNKSFVPSFLQNPEIHAFSVTVFSFVCMYIENQILGWGYLVLTVLYITLVIIFIFILPDLPPPPPPKHLMQTFNNVVNETSYNMLRWTIEDKANVTHFILKGNNSRENISIHANTTNYLFTKDANATVTISLSSVGMCEQMSEIEEELTIDPDNGCKLNTETAFKYCKKGCHM